MESILPQLKHWTKAIGNIGRSNIRRLTINFPSEMIGGVEEYVNTIERRLSVNAVMCYRTTYLPMHRICEIGKSLMKLNPGRVASLKLTRIDPYVEYLIINSAGMLFSESNHPRASSPDRMDIELILRPRPVFDALGADSAAFHVPSDGDLSDDETQEQSEDSDAVSEFSTEDETD